MAVAAVLMCLWAGPGALASSGSCGASGSSVTFIAPDAFAGSPVALVCGPDSAAAIFARNQGIPFSAP